MKTFRPTVRGWLMPPLSLYWRRRQRPLRTAYRPPGAPLTVSSPTAPAATTLTLVSIQHHFHQPRHTTWLSRTSAASRWLPQPTVMLPRVSERIVVKRVIEARPIDGVAAMPAALHLMLETPQASRPVTAARARLSPAPSAPTAPFPMNPSPRAPARVSARAAARDTEVTRTRQLLMERTRTETNELTRTVRTRRERVTDLVRLEWRRHQATRGADAAATPAAPTSGSRGPSASVPQTIGTSAPAIERSTSTQSRVAPASLAVDPATVDRLADTVIRRIERRVRIERERRGL